MPTTVPTEAEFTELTNRVNALENAVAGLIGDVSELEARVTELEDGVITEPPDPGGGSEGTVVIRIGSDEYVYDPLLGTPMGDYVDPEGRFVMSCVRVRRDDCPLLVDFRSTHTATASRSGGEREPAWRCIIFEYSDCLAGDLANLNYTVLVEGEEIEVPDHWANASWRWQPAPWPHPLTDLETLYERKLIPRHDAALAMGRAGNLTNVHEAPPMSLCGFTPDMPMTGGRADIGVLTGWQAEWACTRSPDMLRTVITQGEAAFNWRFRDGVDDALFDAIRDWPRASLYWGSGPAGDPQVYHGTGWHPSLDSAHCPACYALPFMLTGDPYFLELQQGATMYCYMEIPRDPNTVVGSEQIRGVAWSLRYLFQSALLTPDETPSWILNKSIFVDELERQRGLIEAKKNDTWTYRAFAHIIDTYGRWQHAWWQHDYASAIITWISMHYPEWTELRDWMIEGIAARSDPDSGWCPGYPTSYWTNTTSKNDWYPEGSFTSWAEAWDWNAHNVYTDLVDGACPTLQSSLEKNTTYDYFSAMMHALRMGAQAGSDRAKPALDRLTGPWEANLPVYGYTEYKYCASP